jgi:hypothetical protein
MERNEWTKMKLKNSGDGQGEVESISGSGPKEAEHIVMHDSICRKLSHRVGEVPIPTRSSRLWALSL